VTREDISRREPWQGRFCCFLHHDASDGGLIAGDAILTMAKLGNFFVCSRHNNLCRGWSCGFM